MHQARCTQLQRGAASHFYTCILSILISKNAANADRAQHEIVQEAADLDQTCGLAAIQLERVRSRMGDVYRPVQAMLGQVGACTVLHAARARLRAH